MRRMPLPKWASIRTLRNVVSALCLMACCAFLSFWGRSNYHVDRASIRVADSRSLSIVSRPGRLQMYSTQPPSTSMWPFTTGNGCGLSSHPANLSSPSIPPSAWSRWGFTFVQSGDAWLVDAPFWCPILVTAVLCAVAKPRLRFRLSTILILFACVAIVLGVFRMLDNAAAYERRMQSAMPGSL
jgi:hypothetical protein